MKNTSNMKNTSKPVRIQLSKQTLRHLTVNASLPTKPQALSTFSWGGSGYCCTWRCCEVQ